MSVADGTSQLILGEILLKFSGCNKEDTFSFLVVPSITTDVILGSDFCHQFQLNLSFTTSELSIKNVNICSLHLTGDQQTNLGTVVDKFRTLSSESPAINNLMIHHIDTVLSQAVPVFSGDDATSELRA